MAMNHQIRPPFGKAYFLRDSQLAGVVYHSIVGEKMLFNLELKFHIFPRCWQKFACADMLTPHLPFWQCELDKLALDFHELATEKRPNSVDFTPSSGSCTTLSTWPLEGQTSNPLSLFISTLDHG